MLISYWNHQPDLLFPIGNDFVLWFILKLEKTAADGRQLGTEIYICPKYIGKVYENKRRWGWKKKALQFPGKLCVYVKYRSCAAKLRSADDLSPEQDRLFRVQVWLLNYLVCFCVSQWQRGTLGKICVRWMKWIGIFGIPEFTMCLPAIAEIVYFIPLNDIS